MSHNIDTMAYYGDPPWHGLGRSIPERANASQMIRAAGLDWRVEMRPIQNVSTHVGKKRVDSNLFDLRVTTSRSKCHLES